MFLHTLCIQVPPVNPVPPPLNLIPPQVVSLPPQPFSLPPPVNVIGKLIVEGKFDFDSVSSNSTL